MQRSFRDPFAEMRSSRRVQGDELSLSVFSASLTLLLLDAMTLMCGLGNCLSGKFPVGLCLFPGRPITLIRQ